MKKDYKVLLYPANGEPFWAYYLYDTLAKARDYAQEIVKGWDEKDQNRKVKSEIYAGEVGSNYFPTLVETYHAEAEKPLPCYECGGEMVGEKGMWSGKDVCYLRCAKCGHSTGSHTDFQSATIIHNRVCRAVDAAKK